MCKTSKCTVDSFVIFLLSHSVLVYPLKNHHTKIASMFDRFTCLMVVNTSCADSCGDNSMLVGFFTIYLEE